MLKESNISPKEIRSRSGPPRRLAATQEPERKAVLKPAAAESLALSPSHTAGMTTKPGSANRARKRSGGVMSFPSGQLFSAQDMRIPCSLQTSARAGSRPIRHPTQVTQLEARIPRHAQGDPRTAHPDTGTRPSACRKPEVRRLRDNPAP